MSKAEYSSNFQELLKLNQCPVIKEGEGVNCFAGECSKNYNDRLKPRKNSEPPPPTGLSEAYWKLHKEKFGRPPSPSQFRSTKFRTEEPLPPEDGCGTTAPMPYFPSYDEPKEICTPHGRISRAVQLQHINRWKEIYAENLEKSNLLWDETVKPSDQILPPKNRINLGCEKVRELASMAPHAVSTIVRRFITGPPNKDLFWLNRVEVVDCWRRIITKDRKIIDCCVFKPKSRPKIKPRIPALMTPLERMKLREKKLKGKQSSAINKESAATTIKKPNESSAAIKKSKESATTIKESSATIKKPKNSSATIENLKKSSTKIKKSATKKTMRPVVPPFCDPLPHPEARMPWHIPPLRPRVEETWPDVKIQREFKIEDIIPKNKDPYGEERRLQKYARSVKMREQFVHDFLKSTELAPETTNSDPLKDLNGRHPQSQAEMEANAQLKRDAVLAKLLSRDDEGSSENPKI